MNNLKTEKLVPKNIDIFQNYINKHIIKSGTIKQNFEILGYFKTIIQPLKTY